MNQKTILKQALLLQEPQPLSKVRALVFLAREYQLEIARVFLYAQKQQKVHITNQELFFEFLSDTLNKKVTSFTQLQNLLSATSRKENIVNFSNSKNSSIAPFEKTLLLFFREKQSTIYLENDLKNLDKITKVVAVENGENFLNREALESLFVDAEVFVYLGGNPNKLTQQFLANKEVLFFIDLDIVSLNFYEHSTVAKKTLYIPNNFENLLQKYGNTELYAKQRKHLLKNYSTQIQPLIKLIKQEGKVLEQEIL